MRQKKKEEKHYSEGEQERKKKNGKKKKGKKVHFIPHVFSSRLLQPQKYFSVAFNKKFFHVFRDGVKVNEGKAGLILSMLCEV